MKPDPQLVADLRRAGVHKRHQANRLARSLVWFVTQTGNSDRAFGNSYYSIRSWVMNRAELVNKIRSEPARQQRCVLLAWAAFRDDEMALTVGLRLASHPHLTMQQIKDHLKALTSLI